MFPLQGIHGSTWAAPVHSSNNNASPGLDPSLQSFQPKGSEMTRYQTPRNSGIKDMQQYLVSMNVSHTGDIVHMQRRIGQNEYDIEQLRAMFKNDLTILERKISELETSKSETSSPAPDYTTTRNLDYSPTEDMLNDFSAEELAQAYMREAEDKEEVALRLREQAAALGGAQYQLPPQRLLENGPSQDAATSTKPLGFACCETEYVSLQELLEHFKMAHAGSFETKAETVTSPETPTRAPAPRPGRTEARSRAIPIVSPEAVVPASVKSKADSAVGIPAAEVISSSITAPEWIPVAVRQMEPIDFTIPDNKETFSFDFLQDNLGGRFWSSGFYFEPGHSILPSKAYWMLEADKEPFIPKAPGQHGAKLTPFFNETPSPHAPEPDNYMDCPVFIIEPGTTKYRYYGNYSQTRYSDKVCYDCIQDHIPEKTLRQWADDLSRTGRPEWVTKALMQHFWPLPSYDGPFPTDSALSTPATFATDDDSARGTERRVTKALNEHAREIKEHVKEARLHASLLTSNAVFESFKSPDSDIEPGLRLWWEYMECVKYDAGFYDMLVKMKQDPKLAKRGGKKVAGGKLPTTPTPDVGGKTVPGSNIETIPGGELETLPNETDLQTHPNEDVLEIIPHDSDPIIHSPQHSPPPNPKKLQTEQWKSVDTTQAESDSKKRTTFTKPTFSNNEDGGKKWKTVESHLQKAAKQPVTRARNHVGGTKPWESDKSDKQDGSVAGGWQGGGDIQAAKKFNAEATKAIPASGRRKGGPPHLRGR